MIGLLLSLSLYLAAILGSVERLAILIAELMLFIFSIVGQIKPNGLVNTNVSDIGISDVL